MCPYKYNSGAIRIKIDILFPLRVFKNKLRNDLKQKRKTVNKKPPDSIGKILLI